MSPVFLVPPMLLAIYYAVLIATKPRAPKLGSIAVQYSPPPDLSPAATRYVWTGNVDQRTVASVFAGLATKGRIRLERKNLTFTVNKITPPANARALDPEEQSTMEWLFSNFLEKAVFNPGRDSEGCIVSLRGQLDRRLSGQYQVGRTGWVALGLLGSLIASLFTISTIVAHPASVMVFTAVLFLSAVLAAVTVAYMLVPAVASLFRGTARASRLLLGLVCSAGMVAGVIGAIKQFDRYAPQPFAPMVCLMVAMNIAAAPLLRYITPKGIETRRHIEGFREYLMKVEQDPLDRIVKRDSMPPPSAALLSYAIALEVKEAWGDDLTNSCYIG